MKNAMIPPEIPPMAPVDKPFEPLVKVEMTVSTFVVVALFTLCVAVILFTAEVGVVLAEVGVLLVEVGVLLVEVGPLFAEGVLPVMGYKLIASRGKKLTEPNVVAFPGTRILRVR